MSKMQPDTIKDGNPINGAAPGSPKSYSKFNLSRPLFTTQAYANIQPALCMEVTKGDQIPYRHEMSLRTYGMKAPLMSDVFIKKDSFLVYLQSILPNNWSKIVVQPNQGDDVNHSMNGFLTGSELRTIVNLLLSKYSHWSALSEPEDPEEEPVSIPCESLDTIPEDTSFTLYEEVLKFCLIAELFFSDGSLLANLGHRFNWLFGTVKFLLEGDEESYPVFNDFDLFEQKVLEALSVQPSDVTDHIHQLHVNFYDSYNHVSESYIVIPEVPSDYYGETRYITFRHFLDIARQNMNFHITYLTDGVSADTLNDVILYYEPEIEAPSPNYYLQTGAYWPDFNFNDASAYQICCAHFYSNDHVDYIYSADLYRQLIWFYITMLVNASARYFSYNGVLTQYDALSGQMLKMAFASHNPSLSNEARFYQMNLLTALFGYRKPLRYVDYFTGARTQPLAVGDTSVAVSDGKVSIIDTIQQTNIARFLYWAERTKRKVSSYLKELFPGGAPAPDFHDPQFLSHTGDNIKNLEHQNAGDAQMKDANSITSNMACNANRFEFNVMPDRPGYLIQLVYFDVPRAYCTATDREKMHRDRFDMFNPFCQWNGSQPITQSEIGVGRNDTPWAYTMNYMEYKQKYPIAAGGFVHFLPGFAFLADRNIGLPRYDHISPGYIRSWNSEFDPFFISLTGYTPASYFHFIIKHVSLIEAKRPMAYAPELL